MTYREAEDIVKKTFGELKQRWGWKETKPAKWTVDRVLERSGSWGHAEVSYRNREITVMFRGKEGIDCVRVETFPVEGNEDFIPEFVDDFIYKCEQEIEDEIRSNNNPD